MMCCEMSQLPAEERVGDTSVCSTILKTAIAYLEFNEKSFLDISTTLLKLRNKHGLKMATRQ